MAPWRRRLAGSGAVTIPEGRGGCFGFFPMRQMLRDERAALATAET
jgi:hypothetical protein